MGPAERLRLVAFLQVCVSWLLYLLLHTTAKGFPRCRSECRPPLSAINNIPLQYYQIQFVSIYSLKFSHVCVQFATLCVLDPAQNSIQSIDHIYINLKLF